jgi:hypothetical protein
MGVDGLGGRWKILGFLGWHTQKSARISAKKMPLKKENGVFDFFELIKESLILRSD